jgi:DNA (cytosine-5)-methyltransferase 1
LKKKVIDLFAGAGGLSLGFMRAGFHLIGAFENWEAAARCYKENFKEPLYNMDLADTQSVIPVIQKLKPDIIIGGPPCQDFSFAGKRIEADRANLTIAYATIVTTVKPKIFVMENVDRAQKSAAYGNARSIFKKEGYGLTEIVLDASLCGTPQKRKRFICFGALGEKDGFADDLFRNKLSKKHMTLRDYFGDSLGFTYYYSHPRNYSRRGIFSIDEPAPTMRGVNRPIPKGYRGHPNDPCPVGDNVHVLSTEERAWIQTFPKSYKWIGTKTDLEQMIGNAVPVNLAYFVAQRVNEFLDRRTKNEE